MSADDNAEATGNETTNDNNNNGTTNEQSTEQQQQQQSKETQHLNLKVKAQDGTEVCFMVYIMKLK